MNNLLRTLTESQAKSNLANTDLKLLLTTVKEGRRQHHDAKLLADPFYESLDGLLQDLKTVSIDNHDAEAFLKPVSKAEAPDYYDVIQTPMDFNTMTKKVKLKQYKSKKEFKDDLDLIWSNCLTYNASLSHPLRKCALRLKAKSEKLLQNITDRKERTDPFIPLELSNGSHPKVNGHVNGIGRARTYSPSTSGSKPSTPIAKISTSSLKAKVSSVIKVPRRDLSFGEMPALQRTPEGMTAFLELDRGLEESFRRGESSKEAILDRLHDLSATGYDFSIPAPKPDGKVKEELDDMQAIIGDKRKLNGIPDNSRPHKRPRINSYSSSQTISQQQSQSNFPPTYGQSPYISTPSSVASTTLVAGSSVGRVSPPTSPTTSATHIHTSLSTLTEQDPTPLWWSATHSDLLLPNGLPEIPYRSSSPPPYLRKRRKSPSHSPLPLFLEGSSSTPSIPSPTPKRKKKRKREEPVVAEEQKSPPKSLLNLMGNNIKTMKRIRLTHAKFAALGLGRDGNPIGGAGEDGTGAGGNEGPLSAEIGAVMDVDDAGIIAGGVGVDESDKVDDRPWIVRMKETAVLPEDEEDRGVKVKQEEKPVAASTEGALGAFSVDGTQQPKLNKRKKPRRPAHVEGGIEMGLRNSEGCLKWMGEKVLEHAGFQGTSAVALDVMAGVTSEYLQNVGRTIKFLSDKFGGVMTAEEIILHTLFESGISKVSDLERYITDDVERYGSRLGDLEKKLVSAYREATAVDTVVDEEGIFAEDSEDEDNALALGGFANSLDMDFFGFKELGIADEFGMSSLSIPKRLLKGKKKQNLSSPAAKPKAPPLPFPPPDPFVPLTAAQVPNQIGLLHSYYNNRLQALVPPSTVPQPPIASYSRPSIPVLPGPSLPQQGYPQSFIPPPLPPPPVSGQPTTQTSSYTPKAPQPSPAQPSQPGTSTQPTQPATIAPQTQMYPYAFVPTTMPPLQPPPPPPSNLALPDDSPPPAQVKMGPLGQILKTNPTANSTTKKKAKAAAAAGAGANKTTNANEVKTEIPGGDTLITFNGEPVSAYLSSASAPGSALQPPLNGVMTSGTGTPVGGVEKKKKGATGVGTGNGRKKKLMDAQAQAQAQAQQGGQGPQQYPPVVTASA